MRTAAGTGHAPARRLQHLDGSAHAAFLAEALRWSMAAAGHLGEDLRYLNAGGGFGIDDTGDRRFDPARTVHRGRPGPRPLVVEPGRCLAADAGWYAAEVIDLRRRTHGRRFAVLPCGIRTLGRRSDGERDRKRA